MQDRTTEQVPRGGWRPGLYMKPKHIGLVFCVSLVGCMVAFGAGFIVGMGYKANAQVSPYVVKIQQAVGSPGQGDVEEGELTFYDSLLKGKPAKMIPAAETIPTSAPPAPTVVAEQTAPQSTDRTGVTTETAPAPTPSPAVPAAAPVPARQELPVVAERTNLAPRAVAPTGTPSLGTNESVVETFSVQVASFLKPERAKNLMEELTKQGYRAYLHPFEAPGRPLWYRVKVGKFADRDTASLALKKLGKLGKSDAMITRD
jgi:DedD protein